MSSIYCEGARETGARARVEPTDLSLSEPSGEKPYVIARWPTRTVLGDVTILDPRCDTHQVAASKEAAYCMNEAAKAKHKKYRAMTEDQDASFYACAIETSGAWHHDLTAAINEVVAEAERNELLISGAELRQKMSFRIAVAIQERNAEATLECIEYARAPTHGKQRYAQYQKMAELEGELNWY